MSEHHHHPGSVLLLARFAGSTALIGTCLGLAIGARRGPRTTSRIWNATFTAGFHKIGLLSRHDSQAKRTAALMYYGVLPRDFDPIYVSDTVISQTFNKMFDEAGFRAVQLWQGHGKTTTSMHELEKRVHSNKWCFLRGHFFAAEPPPAACFYLNLRKSGTLEQKLNQMFANEQHLDFTELIPLSSVYLKKWQVPRIIGVIDTDWGHVERADQQALLILAQAVDRSQAILPISVSVLVRDPSAWELIDHMHGRHKLCGGPQLGTPSVPLPKLQEHLRMIAHSECGECRRIERDLPYFGAQKDHIRKGHGLARLQEVYLPPAGPDAEGASSSLAAHTAFCSLSPAALARWVTESGFPITADAGDAEGHALQALKQALVVTAFADLDGGLVGPMAEDKIAFMLDKQLAQCEKRCALDGDMASLRALARVNTVALAALLVERRGQFSPLPEAPAAVGLDEGPGRDPPGQPGPEPDWPLSNGGARALGLSTAALDTRGDSGGRGFTD